MNEKKFETVSELIDEQNVDINQLSDIVSDKALSDTWSRYHLIGDVMRDEVPEAMSLDLSASIAQAIDNEPTVLAPKPRTSVAAMLKAKVVQFGKPVGQMAIAASAAGLMILGVQTNVAENEAIVPATQVVQTMPVIGNLDPVSFNYATNSKSNQKQAYIEQQRRFHALLADHKQQVKLSSIAQDEKVEQEEGENNPK